MACRDCPRSCSRYISVGIGGDEPADPNAFWAAAVATEPARLIVVLTPPIALATQASITVHASIEILPAILPLALSTLLLLLALNLAWSDWSSNSPAQLLARARTDMLVARRQAIAAIDALARAYRARTADYLYNWRQEARRSDDVSICIIEEGVTHEPVASPRWGTVGQPRG